MGDGNMVARIRYICAYVHACAYNREKNERSIVWDDAKETASDANSDH